MRCPPPPQQPWPPPNMLCPPPPQQPWPPPNMLCPPPPQQPWPPPPNRRCPPPEQLHAALPPQQPPPPWPKQFGASVPPLRAIINTTLYISETSGNEGSQPSCMDQPLQAWSQAARPCRNPPWRASPTDVSLPTCLLSARVSRMNRRGW